MNKTCANGGGFRCSVALICHGPRCAWDGCLYFPYGFLMCQLAAQRHDKLWRLGCCAAWSASLPLCTPIADTHIADYFFPEKPEFPAGGSEWKCPHCGHTTRYQRTDLVYESQ